METIWQDETGQRKKKNMEFELLGKLIQIIKWKMELPAKSYKREKNGDERNMHGLCKCCRRPL